MSASVIGPIDAVPLIAIHGVGRHVPGEIEKALQQTIGDRLDLRLAVSEFNWDQYVDHRTVTTSREALRSLQRICADFHATALTAISVRQEGVDTQLSRLQRVGCTLLRHLIAFTLAALSAIPAAILAVILPQALMQVGQPFRTDELRWVANWFLIAAGSGAMALSAAIVTLGFARAAVQRAFAPLRSAVTCVVLTAITPVLALISTPLSVSWTTVGGLVGIFSLFGIAISVIEWLLPDTPAYTAWRGFVIAPYLLWVVGALLALQALRYVFARRWYEGPVKVLLDITRYVGDPVYRFQILSKLDAFVRARQGTSGTLVLAAHSLGTIIALDYLCNWARPPEAEVSLITAGSPFRRFFLTWLPGVLFESTARETVAVIGARWRSFRWLNVYRPFDYIGTSLSLAAAGVGVDHSTREYGRLDGHANYWGDSIVLQTIVSELPSVPVLPHRADTGRSTGRFIPPTRDTGPTTPTPHFMVLAAALVLFAIGWLIYSFVGERSQVDATRALIDAQGIRRQVRVAHRELPDAADELATAHEFAFVGEGVRILPPLQLSPILPFSNSQQVVDYRKLVAFVRDDCALERQAKWYEREAMLICTSRRPVEIAYLPTGDGQYYLPAFRASFYLRDLAGWTLYPLVLLVFTSIPALPFIILTSTLCAVFLGRDPDEAISEISG